MMNINFPVDSESTETGGREGDGGRDPLSRALDRLDQDQDLKMCMYNNPGGGWG